MTEDLNKTPERATAVPKDEKADVAWVKQLQDRVDTLERAVRRTSAGFDV